MCNIAKQFRFMLKSRVILSRSNISIKLAFNSVPAVLTDDNSTVALIELSGNTPPFCRPNELAEVVPTKCIKQTSYEQVRCLSRLQCARPFSERLISASYECVIRLYMAFIWLKALFSVPNGFSVAMAPTLKLSCHNQ